MPYCYIFLMFIYFSERERQSRPGEGQRERETHTESEAGSGLQAVSTEPDMGTRAHESWDHDPIRSQTLTNWATQAPLLFKSNYIVAVMLAQELDVIAFNLSTTTWHANKEADLQRNYMIFPRLHNASRMERSLVVQSSWRESSTFRRLPLFLRSL